MKGYSMNMRMLICSALAFSASVSTAKVAISYDISTHQNKRPYQEDRFTHALVRGGEFFGVYDGHGGDKTSSYLQQQLHGEFEDSLSYYITHEIGLPNPTEQHAFESAFRKAEKHVLDHYEDGSTAVVAYIDNNKLYCAWVGDSRLVLESNGTVAFATFDHKPERKDEKERIEQAGGKIKFHGVWRVNGLAVSRSIGDKSCKSGSEGQIVATPEYAQMQLNSDNHFMIIASDGLWDVMSNEDAVKMVKEELQKDNALKGTAQLLQKEAIKRGSRDNITVCVVSFGWSGGITQAHTTDIKVNSLPNYAIRFWDWLFGTRSSD